MRRSAWLCALLWFLAEAALSFPLAMRDDRGKTVRLAARPHRVVSLTVATDEILWDLADEKEKKRILGLSFLAWDPKYSNISKQLDSDKIRAGEDVEALIAAKPDLVIAASFTRVEIIEQLERAGIPVFVFTHFRTFADIRANILAVGDLVGFTKAAQALVGTFEKRLAAVREKTTTQARPSLLNYDRHGVVFGSDCLFDEIVTAAGGENIGRALHIQGWQPVTAERLLTVRPDFVLINANEGDKEVRAEAKRATGWKGLTAVKQGRFIALEGRLLNAASHYAAEAVEILHDKLFPTSH